MRSHEQVDTQSSLAATNQPGHLGPDTQTATARHENTRTATLRFDIQTGHAVHHTYAGQSILDTQKTTARTNNYGGQVDFDTQQMLAPNHILEESWT